MTLAFTHALHVSLDYRTVGCGLFLEACAETLDLRGQLKVRWVEFTISGSCSKTMRLEAQSRSAICLKTLIRFVGVVRQQLWLICIVFVQRDCPNLHLPICFQQASSTVVLVLLLENINEGFKSDQFGRGGTCAFLGDQGSCRFAEAIAAIAIGVGALALFLDTWVLRDDELQNETRLHVLHLDLVAVAIICVLWLSVFINSTVLWVNTLDNLDNRGESEAADSDLKANVAIALAFSLASSIINASRWLDVCGAPLC